MAARKELGAGTDAALVKTARAAARARCRGLGIAADNAEDIAQTALEIFYRKPAEEVARYEEPAQLLLGIVRKVALRTAELARREGVSGTADAAVEGGKSPFHGPAAEIRVSVEGRRLLSHVWHMLESTLIHQLPGIAQLLDEPDTVRSAQLGFWCHALLRVAAAHEMPPDDHEQFEPASLREATPVELQKRGRLGARQLAGWLRQHFPRGSRCPRCEGNTHLLDCGMHSIRRLLSVEGAPSEAEHRGPSTFRSWVGWNDPEGTGLPVLHNRGLRRLRHRAQQARFAARLVAQGWFVDDELCRRLRERVREAEAELRAVGAALQERCTPRYAFGERQAHRQHRAQLIVRAFRNELCRALALAPTCLAALESAGRAERDAELQREIAELRVRGEWPSSPRKGGRPRKPAAERRGGTARNLPIMHRKIR